MAIRVVGPREKIRAFLVKRYGPDMVTDEMIDAILAEMTETEKDDQ
jgi:hypothetical protein